MSKHKEIEKGAKRWGVSLKLLNFSLLLLTKLHLQTSSCNTLEASVRIPALKFSNMS